MLSMKDAETLFQTLGKSAPLRTVSAELRRHFAGASDGGFRSLAAIAIAMHAHLLPPSARAAALLVLADSARAAGGVQASPFLGVLLRSAECDLPEEASFAAAVLLGREEAIVELPGNRALEAALQMFPNVAALAGDLDEFRVAYHQRCDQVAELAMFRSAGVCGLVSDREEGASLSGLSLAEEELSLDSFDPEFCRPCPPALPVDVNELRWSSPAGVSDLQWDYTMSSEVSKSSQLRELFAKAVRKTLSAEDQTKALSLMEDDVKSITLSGMKAKKLPDLVELNPGIAVEFLQRVISSESPEGSEFLSVLLSVDMTVHSMEVVNKLIGAVPLPQDFVDVYITKCISACSATKDKTHQVRLVRLLCVFLQNLLQNKSISIEHLALELQAFCIEFSRIKEAANLFRSLQKSDTFKSKDASGEAGADDS